MQNDLVRFAFRPRPFAPETSLELDGRGIRAERAGKTSDHALKDIATIRLFFAPRGINFNGYRAKIYFRAGRTLAFEDRSFKSLIEQENLTGPYRDFVIALCTRAEALNPNVLLYAGRSATVLALSAFLAIVTSLVLAVVGVRAALNDQWLAGLAILAFTAVFAVWAWRYVMFNRPRPFSARAIPPEILPAAGAK